VGTFLASLKKQAASQKVKKTAIKLLKLDRCFLVDITATPLRQSRL